MPTVLTHPAIPLAIGLGLGKDVIPAPLLIAGVVASVMPDLDVLAFRYGIPYASNFGHRGFSHSLLFAVVLALLGACAFRYSHTNFGQSILVFISCHSLSRHPRRFYERWSGNRLPMAFLIPAFFCACAGNSSIANFDFGALFRTRRNGSNLRDYLGVGSVCDIGNWTVCNEAVGCRDFRMAPINI